MRTANDTMGDPSRGAPDRPGHSPVGVCLLAVCLAGLAPYSGQCQGTSTLSGERWRLDLRGDRGTFDFLVQPKGESNYVSVLRPGGEAAWYGYNEPSRERQSCEVKPAFFGRRGKDGPIVVRCVLDPERPVVHEALHYPLPEGVLVVSRYTAKSLPKEASIVRVAPKLDVNLELLTHYAFSGPDGRRHSGTAAKLGEPDSYAGVGGWGPRGDIAEGLDPDRPYLLLYSPQRSVSLGVIFPLYRYQWRNVHSFLQLWRGGCNFWYTGFLTAPALRSEHAFILYARQVGSPESLEGDLDRVCATATDLIGRGIVEAPELKAALAARQQVDRDWPALTESAMAMPPTRSAWLALLMLRSARECADRDPVAAKQLVDQAAQTLKLEQ